MVLVAYIVVLPDGGFVMPWHISGFPALASQLLDFAVLKCVLRIPHEQIHYGGRQIDWELQSPEPLFLHIPVTLTKSGLSRSGGITI